VRRVCREELSAHIEIIVTLQNLLVKFDEINASIDGVQSLCEHEVLLADSDPIRQQVCLQYITWVDWRFTWQ